MGPITRKRFKFYLNPETVKIFRMVCKSRGLRANRVIEAFMNYSSENPVMLEFIRRNQPNTFHEPTRKEQKIKRMLELAEEVSKLLGSKE